MWIYEYGLKNGQHKLFYTDSPNVPDEVGKFYKENKDNIIDSDIDHFPETVKEYFIGWNYEEDEDKEERIICK